MYFVDCQRNILIDMEEHTRRPVSPDFANPVQQDAQSLFTAESLLPINHRIVGKEQRDLDSFVFERFEPQAPIPGEFQIDIVTARLVSCH